MRSFSLVILFTVATAPTSALAENPREALLAAAEAEDIAGIRAQLEAGADPDVKAKDGLTPLMHVARGGSADAARLLIAAGADVNSAAEKGITPLFLGVEGGHNEVVAALLEHGARVDARNKVKDRPLFVAVRRGHIEIARLLLKHGASATARNWNRDTPLIEAVRYNRLELIPDLLQAGAKARLRNKRGDTALELARKFGDDEAVALLEGRTQAAVANPSGSQQAPTDSQKAIPAPTRKITQPKKIHDVSPVFPQELKSHRFRAFVLLEAVVDTQGRVTVEKVLTAPSPLDAFAIDAVRQWRYTPTLLSGVPVPVTMTVTMSFRANR